MKIALITTDFYPNYGGIAHTLISLCKLIRLKEEHVLYVFNPNYEGKNIFRCIDNNYYKLKDIFLLFNKKRLFKLTLLSLWKIFSNKKISMSERRIMILYLLIKPNILIKSIKIIDKIYPFLKKNNVDVIFGPSTSSYTLVPLYILSLLLNKRKICLTHGKDFLIKGIISLRYAFIRNLDKIILSNKKMLFYFRKISNIDIKKLAIINRGIILDEYIVKDSKTNLRLEYNITDECFVLLSVGRLIERKKFDLVIHAVDKIIKENPSINIIYYIIGEGPFMSKLKDLTEKLKIEKYIKFLGSVNHNIRNKFYKLSDIFLMPSITKKGSFEGFGIAFIEANFFKLPVIGAKTGGITEAIIDGETGFLIEPNNLSELVEKIKYLFSNKELRKRIGETAFKRVIEEYNWDQIINQYLSIFESVLV